MDNSNGNNKSMVYICLLTLLMVTFGVIWRHHNESDFVNNEYIEVIETILIIIAGGYALLYYHKRRRQSPVDKIINSLNDIAEGKVADRYNNHNIRNIDKIGQAVNNLSDKLSKERYKQPGIDNDTMSENNISKFIADAKEIFCMFPKEEYCIIKLDIDKFEYINEIYGYDCGEKILVHIEETLSNIINDNEIYTRGYEGNFLLLLHETNDEEVINKVKYISKKFMQRIHDNRKKMDINFAFGIYRIEEDTEAIEKMIDKANIAQKIAKLVPNQMESYMFYNSKIKNKIIEEKKMESIMYDALENREFKVYLQGKNDLNSSNLSGAEALVRWQSSELGFVSPMDFVPIFEKNGFIIEIDFFVFEEICKNMRKWLDDGVDVKVTSINQSKRHLENDNYVSRLKSIVNKYNIPPELIELEITETAATDNVEKLVEVIDELHKLGFKISIDDFGSGYSSLNMLKQINADVLKIDREFLNEMDESPKSKTIIKHVIKMAKELEIQTITEGVENHEQEEFLRDIGCDMAQGFLYSKPMPILEFEKKYYY